MEGQWRSRARRRACQNRDRHNENRHTRHTANTAGLRAEMSIEMAALNVASTDLVARCAEYINGNDFAEYCWIEVHDDFAADYRFGRIQGNLTLRCTSRCNSHALDVSAQR